LACSLPRIQIYLSSASATRLAGRDRERFTEDSTTSSQKRNSKKYIYI
jgi:hypothetical protein